MTADLPTDATGLPVEACGHIGPITYFEPCHLPRGHDGGPGGGHLYRGDPCPRPDCPKSRWHDDGDHESDPDYGF